MDKLFDDSDFKMIRLACDCKDAFHSLDVCAESDEKTGRLIMLTFNLNSSGGAPLKWRLKQVWKLLRDEDAVTEEFIMREEDLPGLIKFLTNCLRT